MKCMTENKSTGELTALTYTKLVRHLKLEWSSLELWITLKSVLLNSSYCTVLMTEMIRGLLLHTAPSAACCALLLPIPYCH